MLEELATNIEVLEAHCDRLGHLNHVQAVEYLERARRDWYRACGLWDEGREHFGVVVLNVNVDFRRECFLGEHLRVMTRPNTLGRKSFTMAQRVIKADESVAIEGEATSVVMDLEFRTTLVVPRCVAENFPATG